MTREVGLIERQAHPFNAETPLGSDWLPITAVDKFYVRSHFEVPSDHSNRILVDGAVVQEIEITVDEIRTWPQVEVTTTMECAGNGRASLSPPTAGVQWHLGAVGTATWSGAPLKVLLDHIDAEDEVSEMVFWGADHGLPSRSSTPCHFARSLGWNDPVISRSLLATSMNGARLSPEHGGPMRLIVPGWYGMASVKWLERVSLLKRPFEGFYQVDDYVMVNDGVVQPCREMAVRALTLSPQEGARIALRQPQTIAGYAWSGYGPVSGVEVSVDDGQSWSEARVNSASRFEWSNWNFNWLPESAGVYKIIAKARDEQGNLQPVTQVWNDRGYGNNAAVATTVSVHE